MGLFFATIAIGTLICLVGVFFSWRMRTRSNVTIVRSTVPGKYEPIIATWIENSYPETEIETEDEREQEQWLDD